ncbi:MAG: OsmC family protein [Flavobacteriales bacterium]|jgi:peroxiredoxin-like protein|nr:OsmC family protein [Flavobacteriales bacterium]
MQTYIFPIKSGFLKGQLLEILLSPAIEVATPLPFEKGVAGKWSPEHLFTAAISSCFLTTFLAIAEYSKLEFTAIDVKAEGILDKPEGKFLMTEVILRPKLVIAHEKDRDKAQRILEKSEAACLITHSVKADVKLEAEVEVG